MSNFSVIPQSMIDLEDHLLLITPIVRRTKVSRLTEEKYYVTEAKVIDLDSYSPREMTVAFYGSSVVAALEIQEDYPILAVLRRTDANTPPRVRHWFLGPASPEQEDRAAAFLAD